MTDALPRPEYPRPQFERASWLNLNGEWSFSFDPGGSGVERGFYAAAGFPERIIVPFCPESPLSGVRYTDFIPELWYHRRIQVPDTWTGKRVLLHFGGADYDTEVFLDGRYVGRHFGGAASFSFDLTPHVRLGREQHLVVRVQDDLRSGRQPGGKQALTYGSKGCFYTRVTGIWQTVWLEPVPESSLLRCRIVPDYDGKAFCFEPEFSGCVPGMKVLYRVVDQGELAGEGTFSAADGVPRRIELGSFKPWRPGAPHLYDLTLTLTGPSGEPLDQVRSYAGLRKISVCRDRVLLNNEPLYHRFVLDQGYFPEGIWTAPSDEQLRRDIELGIEAGFNGARLHQKPVEERYHYWADRLGYLSWAESPSWGLDLTSEAAARNFLAEWSELVVRDRNHPSIVAWTPLNETWDISERSVHARLHLDAYETTRALDPTRPINDASGGCHVKTDLYTVHIYEQDPALLEARLQPDQNGEVYRTLGDEEAPYEGQPYLVDEFGGIKWVSDFEHLVRHSWGYGEPPHSLEEFYRRLAGQVNALLKLEHVSGYCYTQLTDVEQEQNGIYNYDRSRKFNMARIREIFEREPAAWDVFEENGIRTKRH